MCFLFVNTKLSIISILFFHYYAFFTIIISSTYNKSIINKFYIVTPFYPILIPDVEKLHAFCQKKASFRAEKDPET